MTASRHHQIVQMDLRSRHLDSLKAIVFKQFNQVSQSVMLFKLKPVGKELGPLEQVGGPLQVPAE